MGIFTSVSSKELRRYSLEKDRYCFYIWGLNQMPWYLSFTACPLVILY